MDMYIIRIDISIFITVILISMFVSGLFGFYLGINKASKDPDKALLRLTKLTRLLMAVVIIIVVLGILVFRPTVVNNTIFLLVAGAITSLFGIDIFEPLGEFFQKTKNE